MTEPINLRRYALLGGEHIVAFSGDRQITASERRADILRACTFFKSLSQLKIAVWLSSPYECLVTVMGLALAGKHIYLPGSLQPGNVATLAAQVDLLYTRETLLTAQEKILYPDSYPQLQEAEDYLTDNDVDIYLCTSGSSGEPKTLHKRLSQLEAELSALDQLAGQTLAQSVVISTVSHQHIYGLLHLLLWPLYRQAPIVDEIFQYPESLVAAINNYPSVVLLSSPTHLQRLPLCTDFLSTEGKLVAIISSGGLLSHQASQAVFEQTGISPLEILGSTETGGVAYRQQQYAERFTPLAGVRVGLDPSTSCLTVISNHVPQQQIMGDKVALADDGSFELLGRADRLLKVEGKRLSATAMEAALMQHPLVSEAKIALLIGRREEVGAVVVLNPQGRALLAQLGKLSINNILRGHLLNEFERPLLPRKFRYPEQLPYTAQGKVLLADIEAMLRVSEVNE